MQIDHLSIRQVVVAALAEDLGWGDLTTDSLIQPDQIGEARLIAKEEGVLAGLEVAALVFATASSALRVEVLLADGAPVKAGAVLALVYKVLSTGESPLMGDMYTDDLDI